VTSDLERVLNPKLLKTVTSCNCKRAT